MPAGNPSGWTGPWWVLIIIGVLVIVSWVFLWIASR